MSLFLVLAVWAVFGQAAHFKFVNYDDDENVYSNAPVERGMSAGAVRWALTHPQTGNWIPLTTLSHMLDCQWFGLDAGKHHLVNVALHGTNVVLLFLVLWQLTGSLWRSAVVAALFAVHPLRAESVAWVSERKDVLSGLFFFLTIGAYVRWVRKPSAAGHGTMLALFALGLMAKSMVATLPFVLLLLDYWPLERLHERRELWPLIREKIPLFILAAADCIGTAMVPGLVITGANHLPFLARVGNALVSYVIYLRQMAWPVGLAVPYPLALHGLPGWEVGIALLFLAVLSAVVVAARKDYPCLLMGWLWYLGMLLPVIGIIQISGDAAHADRYTYLPEIGLTVAAVWLAADLGRRLLVPRFALAGLTAGVVCGLGVWGHQQCAYWQDPRALWNHALACDPHNFRAENNLGAETDNPAEAIRILQAALRIEPDFGPAWDNLGIARAKLGESKESIQDFQKAVRLIPRSELAQYDLAVALDAEGDTAGAIARYRKALELDPQFTKGRVNLAIALGKEGRTDEGIAEYRKAIEYDPESAAARSGLGIELFKKGDREAAIAEYRKALAIDPHFEKAEYNLGVALAMTGKTSDAIEHFRKALTMEPNHMEAHFCLGTALCAVGKSEDGLVEYRKALALEPDFTEARIELAKVLVRKGEFDEALGCFAQRKDLNSDPAIQWSDLGDALLQRGDPQDAILSYKQGLKTNPRSAAVYTSLGLAYFEEGSARDAIDSWQKALDAKPDEPSVENNLAWLLATTPEAGLRNGAKALELAQKANQLNGGSNPMVLHTLAAAFAETGRYGEAMATARHAMELAAAQKNNDLASKLPKEIKLYEADQPLRDLP